VAQASRTALVLFVDAVGKAIKTGSMGRLEGATEPFVVGYSGEAFLGALGDNNVAKIDLVDGATCRAAFAYGPDPRTQVRIEGVECG
jgi:outer membrane usher protein